MPKVRMRRIMVRTAVGSLVHVTVPADIRIPDERDLVKARSMLSTKNSKYPTKTLVFQSRRIAEAIGRALVFYCGGYEVLKVPGGWSVGSKGYYHYMGA